MPEWIQAEPGIDTEFEICAHSHCNWACARVLSRSPNSRDCPSERPFNHRLWKSLVDSNEVDTRERSTIRNDQAAFNFCWLISFLDFFLVLLHLGFSQLSSLEVCRWIRSASTVPILMFTSRGELVDEQMVMKRLSTWPIWSINFFNCLWRIHSGSSLAIKSWRQLG